MNKNPTASHLSHLSKTLTLTPPLPPPSSPPSFSLHPHPTPLICRLLLLLRHRRRRPGDVLSAARHLLSAASASSIPVDTLLANRLIDLFAKLGALSDARRLFDELPHRDLCSYNTLVSAYSNNGDLPSARRLFDEMPDRDHFSWSSIISAYTRHSRPTEALRLYRQMQNQSNDGSRRSNVDNKFTASSALAAATAVPCLNYGKEIHCHIVRAGFDSDIVVWGALSDMYAKCGSIDSARRVFDESPEKDVVSWTAMIERYFDVGRREEGLWLLYEMLRVGVRPNEFTFAGVLNAFAEMALEGKGKEVHGQLMRIGYDSSSFAGSALVHMYSKCGSIEKARKVFDGMPKPDLVSWTSIICGYSQNGHPEEALRYFDLLLRSGTKPDHVTFVGVLSASAHSGLVNRGREIFHSIKEEYGVEYTSDHYSCMIDLLSRSGRFKEAEELIDKMPMKPNKFLWASLLGGCRIHKNIRLAKRAAEALFQIEPENAATYVTLANIYGSAGLWDEVEKIRKKMDNIGVVKTPGSSWIEIKRKVHVFLVGDKSHPRAKEIYELLKKMNTKMKEEGYVPDTDFVLHDVEDEQKEGDLAYHSERLAVAFGIIATPEGTPIKVFKNLRICGDCHTAIKFISRIMHRVIVVRDSNRFHHVKGGSCSCGDYW
ncbi:Pentatricopeptide repeat-containing protein [Ananas comosus]|uniref:Pentatricopeptide repeat-containing protein n=1 Tax=Ananas comosus TaxID=4615 RepID=A0A199VFU4_ANACO|nr:Pentatricopeptide repeat-containing protein [Ananas comosus]